MWDSSTTVRCPSLSGRPLQNSQRLVAADDLAGALQEMGDDAAALPLYSEALEAERQVHDNKLGSALASPHPSLLVSISNLAVCLTNLGNCKAALPLAEEALAGWRKVRGEDHEHTLSALSLLSQVQRGLKDFEAAVPLAETTLTSLRERYRHSHALLVVTGMSVRYMAVCCDAGLATSTRTRARWSHDCPLAGHVLD
jgi:tetratricopeptide (TPR) repeat protein